MATDGVRTDQMTSTSEEEECTDIATPNIAFKQSQKSNESDRTSQNMDDPILGIGGTTLETEGQSIPIDNTFMTKSKGGEQIYEVGKSQIFCASEACDHKKDSLSDAISKFLAAEAEVQAQLHRPAWTCSGGSSCITTQEERTETSERIQVGVEENEVGDDVAMVTEMAEVRMDAPLNEESMEMEQQWSSGFNFSQQPVLIAQASTEYQAKGGVFLKGCKWSPDGLCIVTNSEDHVLRLFNIPPQAYGQPDRESAEVTGGQQKELEAVLRIREGELIYDYCWYPKMDSYLPETCCLASCCRDHPVHLWDAFTGKLRATYKSLNSVDELVTPNSLCFSSNGRRLFCGYNKTIRIFHTERPGKGCEVIPTKKKNMTGQNGIISCFAMAPELKLYAAGSYSKSVGLYTADNNTLMCLLQGQTGGVTHLVFSPDRNRLYSGGRKAQEILCWDVRHPGRVLSSAPRGVTTNQRVYFDLDREGCYLVSGNHNGTVTVWDTSKPPTAPLDSNSDPLLLPSYKYKAHSDSVNGISLHPDLPVMATASGQRRLRHPKMGSAGSGDDDSGDDDQEMDVEAPPDHSLKLWSLRHEHDVR